MITPFYSEIRAIVGASASETTTVSLMCDGSPCTLSNKLTLDIETELSATFSLTGGFTQKAMISGGNIGVSLAGVSLDLKLDLDMQPAIEFFAGTDTYVQTYVDPIAAQVRLDA